MQGGWLIRRLWRPLVQMVHNRWCCCLVLGDPAHWPERAISFRKSQAGAMAKIEFEAVTKQFPGAARPAVDSVSFGVREGAICMLLGTSGSGKTTLLRMVNRLIDPTSGRIAIDGVATIDQDP